ncbi:MAG TPA: mechanosensitive ion channel domain-containing protein [Pyrinomonadaceae bacterium]|nr:mechanosensitive ion channel domain-containing protein [Pyrinomonadaceae bacterium]
MNFLVAASALQDSTGMITRVWTHLTQPFTFGRITVSISSVIVGVLVFTVTLLLARYSSTFIERRLARRNHIDPGLRYTICRLIRYVMVTIGTLIAAKQAFALDLTSIAVIFTALSVGIGFGLQYLAADIASGFILLFERPIRVGDRITIIDPEDEGDVQSINLRTTVLINNDRIAINVPNSKLVSQRVINWSYGDPLTRIALPVGVAYESDIDLVTRTLIDATQGVENVLTDPAPRVQFLKFGDFSMDFRLLLWTSKPRRHVQIRSDINYRIAQLFRERNIKIPYPTQEFRLNGMSLPKQFETNVMPADESPRMQD